MARLELRTQEMIQNGAAASSAVLLARADAAWDRLHRDPVAQELGDLLDDDWLFTDYDGRVMDKEAYVEKVSKRYAEAVHVGDESLMVRLYDHTAVICGTAIE